MCLQLEIPAAVFEQREPIVCALRLGRPFGLHLLCGHREVNGFVIQHPESGGIGLVVKVQTPHIAPSHKKLEQASGGEIRQAGQTGTIHLCQQGQTLSTRIQRPGHIVGQVGRSARLALENARFSRLQCEADSGAVVLSVDLRRDLPGQVVDLLGLLPRPLVALQHFVGHISWPCRTHG